MGQWIELTASDGVRASAYRAEPEGKPRGGLVLVQEIFGVNSHMRGVCEAYAREGYVAIAPGLFDRVEPRVELGYSEQDIARGRDLKAASGTEAALRDIAAARDAAAGAGKVGIVGYCWGGYLAWMAAARVPGFAAAVPYYGGGMPDAAGEQPKCPVMGHFGKQDKNIPVDGIQKLAAAHPEAQVFFYDAGHGFNCDQRGSYDAAAAALARERTLQFLRQHVG